MAATVEEVEKIEELKKAIIRALRDLWGINPRTPEDEQRLDKTISEVLFEKARTRASDEKEEAEELAASDFLSRLGKKSETEFFLPHTPSLEPDLPHLLETFNEIAV